MEVKDSGWNPLNDKVPNIRDEMAMREHTMPTMTILEAAQFIGIKAEDYKQHLHLPLVIAKWRYAMADAMLKAGGHIE